MSERQKNNMPDDTAKINANDSANGTPSKPSRFFAFSEKLASSKYLRWSMIFLLPVLILLRYPVDRVDYDLWWHLAHGKYYITHHTLKMDLSIFSWTPTDPTWIYNTCLGSIVIYLFYSVMGGFGLWVMQWLVFAGIFVSFYLFLRLSRKQLDINSIAVIAAIGIASSMSCRYYKPEIFSALFFSWTLLIFFYAKASHRKYLFYLYPLVFALWVNMHGAFIVGLAFLAMAFAGEVLNRIFFARESLTADELVHFGIAAVLSGLATLLNPYGLDYLVSLHPTIMGSFNSAQYSGPYGKLILAYQSLWRYLKDTSINLFNVGYTAWIMTVMIVFVVMFSVYEFIKNKRFDFTVLIISMAFYLKGMETSRASYFFPIAFFFVFFYLVIYRLKFRHFDIRATFFSLLVFIFFFVSVSYFDVRYAPDKKWFGAGLDNYVPVQEVAYLKKYKLDGQLFNDYVVGGYLLWGLYPDYKVFIDPRGALYRNKVFNDYMEFTTKQATAEDIRRFREKYPFKIIFLHYRQMALIFDFLRSSDDWRLLYFEKNAAILIHRSLLPHVQSEMGNVSLSPVRFKDVENPDILLNVFNFYVRLDPRAGRYIYHVFKKNVSDYLKLKPDILNFMDMEIRIKEKEFQDKAGWLSP